MSTFIKGPAFWVATGVVALTAVAVLLATSVMSQEGVSEHDPLNPDELESHAATISAAQSEHDLATKEQFIEERRRADGLPRARTLSTRLDLPPDFAEAAEASSRVVRGVVAEQYLEWGVEEQTGLRITVLASVLNLEDGSRATVAQPAGLSSWEGELSLSYGPEGELLEAGSEYALLVVENAGNLAVMRGHAYKIDGNGTIVALSPFAGNTEIDGLTTEVFEQAVDAATRSVD